MKAIRNVLTATLLTAGAVLTAAAAMSVASAAEQAAATQPPPGPEGRNHGPWHMLGKLDLSAAQKQQIKDILDAARPQMQSLHQQLQANAAILRQTQPTDPNYANIASQASQTHGSLTAQMMAQRAEIRAQVFKVLTPAQQTQLAALEAQMPAGRRPRGRGPNP